MRNTYTSTFLSVLFIFPIGSQQNHCCVCTRERLQKDLMPSLLDIEQTVFTSTSQLFDAKQVDLPPFS